MNCLFLTQSATLPLFFDLCAYLKASAMAGRAGFYISDGKFYRRYRRKNPAVDSAAHLLLKEWDILARAQRTVANPRKLESYEATYGDPVLWNALVADRRIYLGKKATFVQDYASRYSHERMLSILQVAIEELEAFFDRVQPDLVVGFICVTVGEYLAYLMAKKRNIRFLNLRPTRIKNYFYGGESVLEPSERLRAVYENMLNGGMDDTLRADARSYLEMVRKTHAMYEGVIPSRKNQDAPQNSRVTGRGRRSERLRKVADTVWQTVRHHSGRYRHDNAYKGWLHPLWHKKIRGPLRTRLTDRMFRFHGIDPRALNSIKYAFFPLHKEPEVTLLVYNRPHLNQIEVIRHIARSLPVGMKLVVKEHPGAVGYHPVSYYRKIADIPNVVLVPPTMTSREVIGPSRLVVVIGGSIGIEAVMLKKPLVVLGHVPFAFFPEQMVRYVRDMDLLAFEAGDLLKHHRHDDHALEAYVSAVMSRSVPIDFYSTLLRRKGVYVPGAKRHAEKERQDAIERLGLYVYGHYTGSGDPPPNAGSTHADAIPAATDTDRS